MALHGVDREIEQSGDLDQRLVEHVLQDDDAALEDGKLRKARHRGLDRFLAHQHLHGVRAGLVGDVRGRLDRFGHAHRPAAQQVEGAVVGDPEQPGSKRRRLLQIRRNATKARTNVSCTTSSPSMTDPIRRAQ